MSPLWNYSTGAIVSASPAIVHGVVYIGSWNGYEYALNATTGQLVWKSFLGTDPYGVRPIGIASSATVQNGLVYVGGGNSSWYALHVSNGSVAWNVTTGNISQGYYNWASPLIAKGYAYIGIASRGDAPLVYAGLLQVSLTSHHLVHFFNTTANGTIGASIWTTPAFDSSTNTVLVTTGNGGPNGSIYGDSVVALNATSLHLTGNWSIPLNQSISDGDFGATPILYKTGPGIRMVLAADKNGILYAWNESRLSSGPVWERRIALPSTNEPLPNLGPASHGPGRLFVGTSRTQLLGVNYSGSVQSLAPQTGALLWERTETSGPVLGAPVYANGIVAVGAGNTFQILNATSGHLLYAFHTGKGTFEGPAAVSHGEIVIGATNGLVYAFGVASCTPEVEPHGILSSSPANAAAAASLRFGPTVRTEP